MNFPDTIRYYRNQADLTQAELGKRIGVGKSTISMYESGEREPSVDILKKIAFELGVSLSALLGEEEGQKKQDPPEIRMIARAGQKMDKSKRAEMVRVLKAIFPEDFKNE